MTRRKGRTMVPKPAQVVILPDAQQRLSIEEIARAVGTHLEGKYHSYRHRYAEDFKHQEVQLETFHEGQNGQRFRVITEYHEVFTVVDLAGEQTEKPTTH